MSGDFHDKSSLVLHFFLKHLMNEALDHKKDMIIYERCGWSSEDHFSSKYFTKFAFIHDII